jgi:signal peptidase
VAGGVDVRGWAHGKKHGDRRRHKHRKRAPSRAATIASRIALAVTVVLFIALLVPTLLGYKRYVIVSGSMEPTIPVGSVVYDEIVPVSSLIVGDIITFVPPAEYGMTDPVTHRIASITESASGNLEFKTKGDANETIDPWAFTLDQPEQARVEHHLPYVGYFYIFLSQRWVQLFLIAIPALLLGAYLIVKLWRLAGDAVLEEEHAAIAGAPS